MNPLEIPHFGRRGGMSGALGHVENFDGKREGRQEYVKRLEHLFLANGIESGELSDLSASPPACLQCCETPLGSAVQRRKLLRTIKASCHGCET